ncbi:MAG: efflux RND transporter periplasmic adaptor subunit [Spirosomataceae bacterium]
MNKLFLFPFSILLFAASSCKKDNKTTSPEYKSLTEAVYASGNIYPKNEYKLMANADGYLVKQFATEGDIVNNNQMLFQLESASQDARSEAASNILRQSEENYSGSSAALRELEAQIKIAKTKLDNDATNFERYKDLYEKNATPKVEYERAKLSYETSKGDYEAKQITLQRTKNQLYIDLQNSRSNYRVNAREGENFRIKSYESGKVYEIYKKQGELIRKGEAVALIGDANEIYVQLNIDESDFSKISVGQEALLKIDVFGDKVFKSRITKIYPKLNKADQTFRVDAEFVGEKPNAYYGLSVEANIVITQNPKALTIPKAYVVNDSVWVLENGDKKRIKIVKGAENIELVEIKSGLTDKSVIVIE